VKYAVRPFRDGKYQEAIEEFDEVFPAVWWALGHLVFMHWRVEDTETGKIVWQSGLPE